MSCRHAIRAVTVLLIALPFACGAQVKLTLMTYPGPFAEAQEKVYAEHFTSRTGTPVSVMSKSPSLAVLRAEASTGAGAGPDIVTLDADVLQLGCDEGLLEPLPRDQLGIRAQEFMPPLPECGAPFALWSTAMVVNREGFKGTLPTVLKDFFDVKGFAGKRGLPKRPSPALEWALLADGVDPNEVYPMLGSESGVDRAMAKLKDLAKHIVWWTSGNQAIDMLVKGEVAMSAAYIGYARRAINEQLAPLAVIGDGQIWSYSAWAILKGAGNREGALEFIRGSLVPEVMARQFTVNYYVPARLDALPLIDQAVRGNEYGDGQCPCYLGGCSPNCCDEDSQRRSALQRDARFWNENGDRIAARFSAELF